MREDSPPLRLDQHGPIMLLPCARIPLPAAETLPGNASAKEHLGRLAFAGRAPHQLESVHDEKISALLAEVPERDKPRDAAVRAEQFEVAVGPI
jgi:hypothetical protein